MIDDEFSLPEINNGEEYNNIDTELPCYSETNVPDGEVVETIIAKGLALNKVITMRLTLFLCVRMQKPSFNTWTKTLFY